MSVLEIIHRERQDARATGYKRIVHIRVTVDAIPGAPTTVPVTPERARVLGRLLMVRGEGPLTGSVVADPSDYEAMLELLIHPKDYADLLKDASAIAAVQIGEVDRVMGIPVSR